MKYCLYYWLFEPLRGRLSDSPDRTPAFSVVTNYRGAEYDFALFCDGATVPEFARVRIPKLDSEAIPENILPLLQILKEHLLSILRLTYREDIQLFPMTAHSFFNEGAPYELKLDIAMHNPLTMDGALVKNLFCASMSHREEIRLFADGVDARLPVQYRILSFYRLLETEFKVAGRWQKKRFDEMLNRYLRQFQDRGFKGKPASVLHDLRDKCAHIKTGTKTELFGVTHLNHKEAERATKVLPVLREICRDIVNGKGAGTFAIGDIKPWFEAIQSNKVDA